MEPRLQAQTLATEDRDPIDKAIAIMALLRSDEGCPWDREQTFDTIQRHTLEETYEVFDAIERRSWPELKDELGDLLLQVLFYAQMASEAGYFTIHDVAASLNAKLIRRHPHVFEGAIAEDSAQVLQNWERIKAKERAVHEAKGGYLDDIPRSMPALLEATRLGSRAAKVGFDWPDEQGVFSKLREEINELEAEVSKARTAQGETSSAQEEEFGDVLFTAVNLARHLHLNPEFALRAANAKFRERFAAVAEQAGGAAAVLGSTAQQLDEWWSKAKERISESAR